MTNTTHARVAGCFLLLAACADAGPGGDVVGDVAQSESALFTTWTSSGAFTDRAAAIGARFGRNVSVAGDKAAVTRQATSSTDPATTQAFRKTSTGWVRELTEPTPSDRFPVAVVSNDWLVIGEPCGTPSSTCHGRVRAWLRNNGSWFLWAILGDNSSPWDFGRELAISPSVNGSSSLLIRGGNSVYLYSFGYPLWLFLQRFDQPANGYTNASFGYSLSITNDRFAIGAPGGTRTVGNSTVQSPGFVYVYRTGPIALEATLTGDGAERSPSAGLGFGSSVDVSGTRLAVAAEHEATSLRTTYVFTRSSTTGTWSRTATIPGPAATRTANYVTLDGNQLLITSSTGSSGVAGVARFYEFSRMGLSQVATFDLSQDWAPVAMAWPYALIGQPALLSNIGSARIFTGSTGGIVIGGALTAAGP